MKTIALGARSTTALLLLFAVVEADAPATSFLTFDVSRWLTGGNGQFLDPRVEESHKWIEQAIRHSIKFGIDEDHDGEIDDGDMHGSDD